jgi:hypothetical protein
VEFDASQKWKKMSSSERRVREFNDFLRLGDMASSDILISLADDFASVVPAIDAEAEHDRWQAGIGPFEEERQVEMLRAAVEGDTSYSIEIEIPYLDGGQRVDLFIESEETAIPVEAKLPDSATTMAILTRTALRRCSARFRSERPLLS